MDVNTTPAIPGPPTRIPLHARQISYQVFALGDGLFDVEGAQLDTKEFPFDRPNLAPLSPGDAVHHMTTVVTVDEQLVVVGFRSAMHTTPLGDCQEAREPLTQLVGSQLGRGWRKLPQDAMGGTAGCPHLRELLFNLATAAIQGVSGYRDQERRRRGLPPLHGDAVPHDVGSCMTWRSDGPAVLGLLPQFAQLARYPPVN